MPMNYLKQAAPLMSRGNEAPLSELNPSLASVIEDTILFGRVDEFDQLTEILTDHPHVTDELRYGVEGLKYFRTFYAPTNVSLSPAARQRVSQFDTAWSMRLIDLVRDGASEVEVESLDYTSLSA